MKKKLIYALYLMDQGLSRTDAAEEEDRDLENDIVP